MAADGLDDDDDDAVLPCGVCEHDLNHPVRRRLGCAAFGRSSGGRSVAAILLWLLQCLFALRCSAHEADLSSPVLHRGGLPLDQRPHIVLVTYGHGDVYIASQKRLVETSQSSIHYAYAWNNLAVRSAFPNLNNIWNANFPTSRRHLCLVVKSILVQRALNTSDAGDWVMWVDSSKYFRDGVVGSFYSFILNLLRHDLLAYPGTALCGLTNIDQGGMVSRTTFKSLDADRPRFWFAPHFQSNFFAFAKNNLSDHFFAQWVAHSLNLEVSCASLVDDQAPFSVLVSKFNLPFINFCRGQNDPDFQALKDVSRILSHNSSSSANLRIETDHDAFLASFHLNWDAECEIKGSLWKLGNAWRPFL